MLFVSLMNLACSAICDHSVLGWPWRTCHLPEFVQLFVLVGSIPAMCALVKGARSQRQ